MAAPRRSGGGRLIPWLRIAAETSGRRHATLGFGYLADPTNFEIPFRRFPGPVGDTYARALLVCLLNTLLASAISIVAATLLGLLVGIMRLSTNWLGTRHRARVHRAGTRIHPPQLVQIIFWYVAVLQTLPGPRRSILLPGGALLNVRGLYLPSFVANDRATMLWPLALALLLVMPFVWRVPWRGFCPIGAKSLLLILVAIPLFVAGIDHTDLPALSGFNIAGGVQVVPELVALCAGLWIYGAAFIAEIVRAAILSVQKGQREAALSCSGCGRVRCCRRSVLLQALRVMVPPITSRYPQHHQIQLARRGGGISRAVSRSLPALR